VLRAVFFDLDETLIDAGLCHLEAGVRAFAHFGMDYAEAKRLTGNFYGMRMTEIMAARRDRLGLTEEQAPAAELNRLREQFYAELLPTHVSLLPGAADAVAAAAAVGPVAVVSSETSPGIEAVLRRFGLAKHVAFVVGGDHVTLGKPDPECYELAWRKVQRLQPALKADCLVVEDSGTGAKAAIAAGLPVCLVPMVAPTHMVEPNYTLESLLDLPTLLTWLSGGFEAP